MKPMQMQTNSNSSSRKKFLRWTGLTVLVAAFARFSGFAQKKKQTVRMLTQDGRLVEIDSKALGKPGKKITHDELLGWVKHKEQPK
jgi:hypothetical protein